MDKLISNLLRSTITLAKPTSFVEFYVPCSRWRDHPQGRPLLSCWPCDIYLSEALD